MEGNREKKQVITTEYYKKGAKKYDYIDRTNEDAFLHKFLNDNFFLKQYPKMHKTLKKKIRQCRKRNGLEIVYNKVKMQNNAI